MTRRPFGFPGWCVVALAAVVGCDHDAGTAPRDYPVTATPASTTYAPGDSVFYTLRNASANDILFSDCLGALERRTPLWVAVPIEDQPLCPNSLTFLRAGQELRPLAGVIPISAKPGVYRYVLPRVENELLDAIEPMDAHMIIAFNVKGR